MGTERADIVIVGAGAAGLMAAAFAGRSLSGTGARVVLVDGAKKVGVKILVAGGGRCNVTHHAIDEKQYAGGSRNTIRKVLRSFGVADTVSFFEELGVHLKREETGKLFPVTDSAHTVLNALLGEVRRVGVELLHPWRVNVVEKRRDGGFLVQRDADLGGLVARRVVLATGGMALPRSGSDGGGYRLARGLGHTITERIFPALVPLVAGHRSRWITELKGVSARVRVDVCAGNGQRLARFENDILCTHFGLSGPGIMDASRYLTDARGKDKDAELRLGWLVGETFESVDASLRSLGGKQVLTWVRSRLPERLARAICEIHGVDPSTTGASLTKDARRAIARALTEMPVDIAEDRGFNHAEVTAGGVLLTEVDVKTMDSRVCDGLSLIGEILDVDGRIGGFNFQWAWATGAIAGRAIASSVRDRQPAG